MKKKTLGFMLSLAIATTALAGCSFGGNSGEGGNSADGGQTSGLGSIAQPIEPEGNGNTTTEVGTGTTEGTTEGTGTTEGGDVAGTVTGTPADNGEVVYIKDLEAPDGYVFSELTGEPIEESIKNQRPLAVMVDNEITALDHFGINDCDIVFECMNSTANGRITRLMCIIKDYDKIEQLGSVRSARTVNMVLSAEYNAILCHDGGPFYINDYYSMPEINHLNGVFSRVPNGKPTEFTEYVLAKDVNKYLGSNASFDVDYNKYYSGAHFEFAQSNALKANNYSEIKDVTDVYLPYDHNKSELHYNPDTNLYEYYEYGNPHVDGTTGEVLAFRNVIIQCADYEEYDPNGYLWYKIQGGSDYGYYLTDGKAVPILWYRGTDITDNTKYIDDDQNPIYLNAGNTYITLCPKDVWSEVVMK